MPLVPFDSTFPWVVIDQAGAPVGLVNARGEVVPFPSDVGNLATSITNAYLANDAVVLASAEANMIEGGYQLVANINPPVQIPATATGPGAASLDTVRALDATQQVQLNQLFADVAAHFELLVALQAQVNAGPPAPPPPPPPAPPTIPVNQTLPTLTVDAGFTLMTFGAGGWTESPTDFDYRLRRTNRTTGVVDFVVLTNTGLNPPAPRTIVVGDQDCDCQLEETAIKAGVLPSPLAFSQPPAYIPVPPVGPVTGTLALHANVFTPQGVGNMVTSWQSGNVATTEGDPIVVVATWISDDSITPSAQDLIVGNTFTPLTRFKHSIQNLWLQLFYCAASVGTNAANRVTLTLPDAGGRWVVLDVSTYTKTGTEPFTLHEQGFVEVDGFTLSTTLTSGGSGPNLLLNGVYAWEDGTLSDLASPLFTNLHTTAINNLAVGYRIQDGTTSRLGGYQNSVSGSMGLVWASFKLAGGGGGGGAPAPQVLTRPRIANGQKLASSTLTSVNPETDVASTFTTQWYTAVSRAAAAAAIAASTPTPISGAVNMTFVPTGRVGQFVFVGKVASYVGSQPSTQVYSDPVEIVSGAVTTAFLERIEVVATDGVLYDGGLDNTDNQWSPQADRVATLQSGAVYMIYLHGTPGPFENWSLRYRGPNPGDTWATVAGGIVDGVVDVVIDPIHQVPIVITRPDNSQPKIYIGPNFVEQTIPGSFIPNDSGHQAYSGVGIGRDGSLVYILVYDRIWDNPSLYFTTECELRWVRGKHLGGGQMQWGPRTGHYVGQRRGYPFVTPGAFNDLTRFVVTALRNLPNEVAGYGGTFVYDGVLQIRARYETDVGTLNTVLVPIYGQGSASSDTPFIPQHDSYVNNAGTRLYSTGRVYPGANSFPPDGDGSYRVVSDANGAIIHSHNAWPTVNAGGVTKFIEDGSGTLYLLNQGGGNWFDMYIVNPATMGLTFHVRITVPTDFWGYWRICAPRMIGAGHDNFFDALYEDASHTFRVLRIRFRD